MSKRGQATVEYILMILFAVIIASTAMRGFLGPYIERLTVAISADMDQMFVNFYKFPVSPSGK